MTVPSPAVPGESEERVSLPCEDVDAGMYLHSTTPTVISGPAGAVYLVPAADFMAVQKDRDDLRRTVALINAWRLDPNRNDNRLHRMLAVAGETVESGRAMLGIIAWADGERRKPARAEVSP